MSNIVVYSKSNCVQCTATKRMLKQLDLDYDEKDLEKDEDAMKFVMGLGAQSAPVVTVENDLLCQGFRPDKLKSLVGA